MDNRWSRRWDAFERGLLGLLAAAMVGLAALQIVLRAVFHTGVPWIEPLLGILLLWLTLAGALAATGQQRHISMDALSHILPGRWRNGVRAPVLLFCAVVCGGLARAGWQFVAFQREAETARLLGLPFWAYSYAIPVFFGAMAIRFAIQAVCAARAAMGRGETAAPNA